MDKWTNQTPELARAYEAESEAAQWRAPEIVFGLAWDRIQPGQDLLDVGIGTGLGAAMFAKAGLNIHGLDVSAEMAAVCRERGLPVTLHDLTVSPWPFGDGSMDHATCVGVMYYLPDCGLIFSECARILRPGGTLCFVTARRKPGQAREIVIGNEHTASGKAVTRYRMADEEVVAALEANGLSMQKTAFFTSLMGREGAEYMNLAAWLAEKE